VKVVSTIKDIRSCLADYRKAGKRIGLVTTMGNLHDGHVSLVAGARKDNDVVAVSIFVNPTQFGPNEDFNKYPRTLQVDLQKLEPTGCDIVFTPDASEIYPEGASNVSVVENEKSKMLCGKFRPGHFDGVLTVVLKLFNIIEPDKAYFGLKDYQQYLLIKDMVRSLNLSIDVIGCPLVREQNGLAMSSRNSFLNEAQKKRALSLSRALFAIKDAFNSGKHNVPELKVIANELMSGHVEVQYLEVSDADILQPVEKAVKGNVVAAACFCDDVRLIDNIIL